MCGVEGVGGRGVPCSGRVGCVKCGDDQVYGLSNDSQGTVWNSNLVVVCKFEVSPQLSLSPVFLFSKTEMKCEKFVRVFISLIFFILYIFFFLKDEQDI